MGWSLVMGREVNDDIDLEHMSWVCQDVEGEDKMKRSHKEALLNNCVCKLILYETRDGHRTHEMILLWRPNCRVFLLALWVSFRSLLVQKRWTISGPGVEKQQFNIIITIILLLLLIFIFYFIFNFLVLFLRIGEVFDRRQPMGKKHQGIRFRRPLQQMNSGLLSALHCRWLRRIAKCGGHG